MWSMLDIAALTVAVIPPVIFPILIYRRYRRARVARRSTRGYLLLGGGLEISSLGLPFEVLRAYGWVTVGTVANIIIIDVFFVTAITLVLFGLDALPDKAR
jgi:hypothetical protein